MNQDKNALRKCILAKRAALDGKEERSEKICRAVCQSAAFKNAKTVFVYLAYNGEVDASGVISQCFAQNKQVCVPVVKEGCLMDAVEITADKPLVKNSFGIFEPSDKTAIVPPKSIDLCLIPGSAFDENLNRIGYGKGFYDRYLPLVTAKKAALAFACQVVKSLPVEDFDVKMDAIVTEKGILGDL